jgi:tRNA-Thr(GGU) m(6)t(6)A37 methyltransferase TsaA
MRARSKVKSAGVAKSRFAAASACVNIRREEVEFSMVRRNEIRKGEVAVEFPDSPGASFVFIGRIHTPWNDRLSCPRQGRLDGPVCRIEVFEPWIAALECIERYEQIEVLYWLHESRRDLVKQSPANDGSVRGTFSLRSPVRPNPIGTQLARLVRVERENVFVQGLDCLDGTPLLDLKPDRCAFTPVVPRQSGDNETQPAKSG